MRVAYIVVALAMVGIADASVRRDHPYREHWKHSTYGKHALLGVTAGAGVLFALLHVREWMGLIGEGVRLFQNPWGAPLFGASFFSITGLHLLHVIGGVDALLVVALGYNRGGYNADHLEVWALYWHFVDLVWMFVVPFVYLLNIAR